MVTGNWLLMVIEAVVGCLIIREDSLFLALEGRVVRGRDHWLLMVFGAVAGFLLIN